jgi:hypothetical protein
MVDTSAKINQITELVEEGLILPSTAHKTTTLLILNRQLNLREDYAGLVAENTSPIFSCM